MAVVDFTRYYKQVESQYLELVSMLPLYTQAYREGSITEERLQEIENDIAEVKKNYETLAYVQYLLGKRKKPTRKEQEVAKMCSTLGCDEKAIVGSNNAILERFREQYEDLSKEKE